MFAGAVTIGLSSSTTVTTWLAVDALPTASVAVQITVVAPTGNAGGALLVIVSAAPLETLSDAVAVPIAPTYILEQTGKLKNPAAGGFDALAEAIRADEARYSKA